MKAGKDVYCEKPMIHLYSDGPEMIETAKATNRIIQIGSQRVSSILYAKAKELLASGAIGKLNMVTAHWDRNSSMGAWNYTIPPDASPETCDWPRFLGHGAEDSVQRGAVLPVAEVEATMAAAWPAICLCISSAERISLPARMGRRRAWRRARLRFWKDGRDALDVVLGLFDYRGGIQSEPAREFCGWRRREREPDLHRGRRHDGDWRGDG